MEEPGVTIQEMTRVLNDLRRVNTLFGGVGPILREIWPRARRLSGPVRVIDIACGDGHVLRRLIDRARGAGIDLEATALDVNPIVLEVAAVACRDYPEITLQQGDALALPFPDGGFDFAISCLALHHFGIENAPLALREMRRVVRCGFVVNDLRRSRIAYAVTAAALTLLQTDRITRHDGPISILRAYGPQEYHEIIERSGIPGIRYGERLWFRSLLTWRAKEREEHDSGA